MSAVPMTSPKEAARALAESPDTCRLIDVRTPAEHAGRHAVGAECVPLDEIKAETVRERLGVCEGQRFLVICHSGARAREAAERMASAGLEHVSVVEGGTQAWCACGLSVEEAARQIIPIDRQVRIAAGSMAAVGALLALFLHAGFAAIPLFIGAGLVYTGITDNCMMATVLAKMPWNRVTPA